MKNVYLSRHLMAFLTLFFYYSFPILAQTQPTPQNLPYNQNFDALLATDTAYPLGFQGWTASITPGSAYNTAAILVADKPLTPNSTAATTSGNIHNYNGKIGFQNTGSLDLTLGFAFTTTGQTGITVQYDAMVIRNPYDGTSNTRISEMALQYRVGATAPFTTLASTSYLSNTVKQIAGTTPVNSQPIKVILPAECENQSIVQIRWISKQNSGTGSRPSFAIDNISIQNDVTAPVNISGFPKIDNVLSNGFDFSTQINEIGKTYFVLLPAGSAKPSAAQIKAGLDANGISALQADVINNTDASLISIKTITGLTLNTNYTIFSIAEDNYGNIQADSNQLNITTANVLVPAITTTINSLNLGFSEQNFDSNTLNYQVQANNLNSAVTLTSTGNFSISKESNANFQTSLTFDKTDFDVNNTPTVYVRFTPNNTGDFSGQITHQSTGATDKIITLSGIGINPYFQNFNDANVLSNSGWTAYSVAGNKIKWASTSSRFNSSPAAIQINGYTEIGASKDWLISPKLRLDTFNKFPILSFYSRKFYAGSALKLMVSVDYDGVSSPETATWTALEGDFPTTTGAFKKSNYINLEAYKTNHTYLAWVYETITNTLDNAAEWTVDDVSITNETTFLASNPNLSFGEVSPNSTSDSQSFIFKAGGYGDFAITAPADYQLSTDNLSFQSSINVSDVDALIGKTVYARFTPTTKALTISGSLTVTATGLNQQIGSFTGSSWPKTETFDIVSYNLEFFGSDVKNTSNVEFGPTDDALQIDNVAKVMNKLNADVYVVQEVSDEPSLDLLIQKLNINGKTFDKTISPVWSYSFNAADPNFPPQKLVVLYNTQTIKVKKTRAMFSELYDNIRSGKTTLANYPGGNSTSFFASGRLPYMVEIETNIAGVKKNINLIDLHARANSGTDISKYDMRKYDAEFLKDSLDAHYPNTDFIILGDFNDDVKASVIAGNPSSYQKLVEDTTRYNALTLDISKAGAYSFLSSGGFLDHIITSNELTDEYVPNSIAVYDPRTDIPNYVNTTSDHGPIIARFEFKKSNTAPIVKLVVASQSTTIPNQIKINLQDVFSDDDLDVLTYSVSTTDATIANVSISGSTLTILSKKVGETTITITANDGLGGTISTSFITTISSSLSTIDFDLSKKISARAYPNPANDVVTIAVQSNEEKNILLKLFDLNGRLIGSPIEIKGASDGNITKIPVGHLQSGFYFYTLSIDNKVVLKDKIIIQ
jgi:endonuclease/exonuclease/phosphatase family metal-dependent hydrolase